MYEHGNTGIMKQQVATTQFIVWMKEFAESYGQYAPDENKIVINYWLTKKVLFNIYIEESLSPHLAKSTFYEYFELYFGPQRRDKTLGKPSK